MRSTEPDVLQITGMPGGTCQVHGWISKGMGKRLIQAMRDTHPTGINVCIDCIARARLDAKQSSDKDSSK